MKTVKIELKPARVHDEQILAYIQTESWKAAFAQILSRDELIKCTDIKKTTDMYKRVLQQNLVHMTIEYIDNKPHGIAGWGINRGQLHKDAAELICIHSLKDNWHKGYGSIMMRQLLDEIKQAGYAEVILWVFEENYQARGFYEKHGFISTDHKNYSHGAVEIMYLKNFDNS